jgi:hypothetical protein
MYWLLEDPTLIISVGILGEVILAIILVKSGRAATLLPMLGLLVLTLLGVLLEWMVVTDAERVSDTIEAARQAVAANDVPEVLKHIAPDALELRTQVRTILPKLKIEEAKVKNIKVTVNSQGNPPTARAEFIGNITVTGMNMTHQKVIQLFIVKFRQDGDHWVMTEAEHRPPTASGEEK